MRDFFVKSHGLGNDYLVVNSNNITFKLTPENIRTICDVHYGIGSDGILVLVDSKKADFGMRILNPDGSEAEKSGNGLRIFAKFLFDHGYTGEKYFTIETPGGIVNAEIVDKSKGRARTVRIDMGQATFEASRVPVTSTHGECLDEELRIDEEFFFGEKSYMINCVSVGNPHCVILRDELSVDEIKQYGHHIENNPKFPNRINVQFAKVVTPELVEALIWERGAGYTLASGSSASAVAAVMVKKGLTARNLTVKMPGGELKIDVGDNWQIQMTGEVRETASGHFSPELIEVLKR